MSSPETFHASLCVLGSTKSGKSSLISRYVHNYFPTHYDATVATDLDRIDVELGDCRVMTQIWDTTGVESSKHLIEGVVRSADAFILVFDINDNDSLLALGAWRDFIAETRNGDKTECPIMAVATKCDLDNGRSDSQQIKEFIERTLKISYMNDYFETSAKMETAASMAAVNSAFQCAAQLAIKAFRDSRPSQHRHALTERTFQSLLSSHKQLMSSSEAGVSTCTKALCFVGAAAAAAMFAYRYYYRKDS